MRILRILRILTFLTILSANFLSIGRTASIAIVRPKSGGLEDFNDGFSVSPCPRVSTATFESLARRAIREKIELR